MTTATPYGNGVGSIIQSMFARAKNLWVPRQGSALARIDVDRVVRAATPVNGGVAARNTIGNGARSVDTAAMAGRLSIPLSSSGPAKIRS